MSDKQHIPSPLKHMLADGYAFKYDANLCRIIAIRGQEMPWTVLDIFGPKETRQAAGETLEKLYNGRLTA